MLGIGLCTGTYCMPVLQEQNTGDVQGRTVCRFWIVTGM